MLRGWSPATVLCVLAAFALSGYQAAKFSTCNFDADLCAWENDASDNFDWERRSLKTPSDGTGPLQDHTGAAGYYLFIECSTPQYGGDVARLISPELETDGCIQLTLWYTAYGSKLGRLAIKYRTAPYTENWHLMFDHQGEGMNQDWQKWEVIADVGSKYKIVIEGVCGDGYQGDYAIDDVVIKPVRCKPTTTEPSSTEEPLTLPWRARDTTEPWVVPVAVVLSILALVVCVAVSLLCWRSYNLAKQKEMLEQQEEEEKRRPPIRPMTVRPGTSQRRLTSAALQRSKTLPVPDSEYDKPAIHRERTFVREEQDSQIADLTRAQRTATARMRSARAREVHQVEKPGKVSRLPPLQAVQSTTPVSNESLGSEPKTSDRRNWFAEEDEDGED